MLKQCPFRQLTRPLGRSVPKTPALSRAFATNDKNPRVPDSNIKESKPKAYAPPMPNVDLGIPDPANKTPYVPKEKYQRVMFEYLDAPSGREDLQGKPRSRWRPVVPVVIGLIGGVWALYTYNYFTDTIPNEYLDPDKFIPFVITNKVDVDNDHFLIELKPKYNRWKANSSDPKIWNGLKLWSVEIKQPQIMVVRKYTPLPLEIFTSDIAGSKPIIRVQNEEDFRTGKLAFYIKKYDQGEVARWIYKRPIGSELELRGPYIDYEFPKSLNNNHERPTFQNLPSHVVADPIYPIKPDNLAFFAAGTGITPFLQTALSRNPYKGFIDVYYSRRTEPEMPIPEFFYFLEKLDRARFHHFIQDLNQELKLEDIPTPTESNLIEYEKRIEYEREKMIDDKLKGIETTVSTPSSKVNQTRKFQTALEQAQATKSVPKDPPSFALVCGPDGYLTYVSGTKPFEGQGKLGGLLKEKGWSEKNVLKM